MIPYNPPINDMTFLFNDLDMLPKVAELPGYEERMRNWSMRC